MITIVKGAVKIIDLSQNGCETYPARTMKIFDWWTREKYPG